MPEGVLVMAVLILCGAAGVAAVFCFGVMVGVGWGREDQRREDRESEEEW